MPKAIHASEDVGRGGASKGFAGDREVAGHAFDQGSQVSQKAAFPTGELHSRMVSMKEFIFSYGFEPVSFQLNISQRRRVWRCERAGKTCPGRRQAVNAALPT
jgi:hypothetical protein